MVLPVQGPVMHGAPPSSRGREPAPMSDGAPVPPPGITVLPNGMVAAPSPRSGGSMVLPSTPG
jgi:hypothetical protein